jgi:hypothetical protein
MEDEPSYLAFARLAVKNGEPCSPIIVAALIERIDRDAKKLS